MGASIELAELILSKGMTEAQIVRWFDLPATRFSKSDLQGVARHLGLCDAGSRSELCWRIARAA